MRSTQFSIVLITSSQSGIRDSGSGFVFFNDGALSYVATCSHVLRALDPATIQINGRPAQVVADGAKHGLDIAILSVSALSDSKALKLKGFVRSGASLYGYAFKHLYGDDYVRGRTEGKTGRLLSVQGKSAEVSIPAWEVLAAEDSPFQAGNSGAPLIEAKTHKVVGVLSHAYAEGKRGIALSPEAIARVWLTAGEIARLPFPELESAMANDDADAAERPPELPPPKDPDDPQRGRFGGKSTQNGRRLLAKVTDAKAHGYFYIDVIVQSTDGTPLRPSAWFFLHDTYPKTVIKVSKPDEGGRVLALRDVYSYGVYTAGCQVRDSANNWVNLEYNLDNLKDLPARFHAR